MADYVGCSRASTGFWNDVPDHMLRRCGHTLSKWSRAATQALQRDLLWMPAGARMFILGQQPALDASL